MNIVPNAIIRTNRRSISLTITKNGELVVRAPKRLDASYILKFVESKSSWITRKLKEIEENNAFNINIKKYNQFFLFGKLYERVEVEKIKKIEVGDFQFLIPAGKEQSELNKLFINFYKEVTNLVIQKRLDYFAKIMDLNYLAYKIDNCKTRWGSCDSKGLIKFNLRLAMLPHKTIDYIIIHELAHLVEFNHSKNFYKVVESVMPDYKTEIKRAKQSGYLLQLFRN